MSKASIMIAGLTGLVLNSAIAATEASHKPAIAVKAQLPTSHAGVKPAVVRQVAAAPALPPGEAALPPAVPLDKLSAGEPTTPEEISRYSVLMDADSGKILWARNADARREIASTTKIMTAILLIEKGKQTDLVTAPPGVDKIEESSLHLTPGETLSVHDLLYAMLLRSANDTAVAGADYIAGSVPAFANLMNDKARDLGATNTHFVTPNGLYDPNHYSTAADLAKITRYAILNLPEFNEIVKTQRYKLTRSIHKDDAWVRNTACKFLKEFPGADGVKTGYIHQAGHCFVGSATRHGWRLIAVALNSNKCREDVESILNYGFHDFERVLTMRKNDAAGNIRAPGAAQPVPVEAAADAVAAVSRWKDVPRFTYRVTPLPALPTAPIAAGTKLGTISILSGGVVQAAVDAVAAQSVAARPAAAVVRHLPTEGGFFYGFGQILAAVSLVILGGRIYARTVAKGSGSSRDRVASQLRGAD